MRDWNGVVRLIKNPAVRRNRHKFGSHKLSFFAAYSAMALYVWFKIKHPEARILQDAHMVNCILFNGSKGQSLLSVNELQSAIIRQGIALRFETDRGFSTLAIGSENMEEDLCVYTGNDEVFAPLAVAILQFASVLLGKTQNAGTLRFTLDENIPDDIKMQGKELFDQALGLYNQLFECGCHNGVCINADMETVEQQYREMLEDDCITAVPGSEAETEDSRVTLEQYQNRLVKALSSLNI